MNTKIRNFCIIAHIDHGKSTLADRFLEVTHTVENRKMKEQYLDQLELERERGITIKMAPVRMMYKDYILNLIDTPGHSDFSYEVSRALEAVDGAVLLVDATQGIQAQTLANFYSAKKAGLKILGAINKIDIFEGKNSGLINPFHEDVNKLTEELAELIGCKKGDIYKVSGKTGTGVEELLSDIIKFIPPPKEEKIKLPKEISGRALIFDSFYDNHKGVIASIRVFDGEFVSDSNVYLIAERAESHIKEIGYFLPELKSSDILKSGEIGYIATGIKDPGKIKIGDTSLCVASHFGIKLDIDSLALHGYEEPKPVIFVSFYPEHGDEYDLLRQSLEKLKLNDSALTIEPDQNEVLGRGFKIGCLGRLHFEITAERLRREFNVGVVNTFPSVRYDVRLKDDMISIIKPEELPSEYIEIFEPVIEMEILLPRKYISSLFSLQKKFRLTTNQTETMGDRVRLNASMPLVELVSDFDDYLKSVTEGYGSFSYKLKGYEKADVLRVDLLVSGEAIPGLSRFIPKESLDREARRMVEKLKELLPRRQFTQAIQAKANGRIIARADIAALRKDVTGYLYGGDRSRKIKLWKKQQRGKKRLKERAEATIPPSIFKELLKKE